MRDLLSRRRAPSSFTATGTSVTTCRLRSGRGLWRGQLSERDRLALHDKLARPRQTAIFDEARRRSSAYAKRLKRLLSTLTHVRRIEASQIAPETEDDWRRRDDQGLRSIERTAVDGYRVSRSRAHSATTSGMISSRCFRRSHERATGLRHSEARELYSTRVIERVVATRAISSPTSSAAPAPRSPSPRSSAAAGSAATSAAGASTSPASGCSASRTASPSRC